MKAKFVYESVKFERGMDPRKVMGIGHYWKSAVDTLVDPLGKDAKVEWDVDDTIDPEGTPVKYLRTFVSIPDLSPVQLLIKWVDLLIKPEFGGPPLGPKDKAFMIIEEGMRKEGQEVLDEDQLFYFPERKSFYRISTNEQSLLKKIKVEEKFTPPIEKYPGDEDGIVLDMAIWYQKV